MKEYNKHMEDFKRLTAMIEELNGTNSSSEKKEILAKYPECKKALLYTYDPFRQYYISSENIKKRDDLQGMLGLTEYDNFYELLDALNERTLSGHAAIATVQNFIQKHKEYEDLILRIIDRSLKTRADAKLINKVWPNLIPSFNVALANRYDEQKEKVDFKKDKWFASRKLDGVRTLTIIDEKGDITIWSRKGKEFFTLQKVKDALKKYGFKSIVLDGETCIVDEYGDENFSQIIKYIRRKDFTIEHPKYKIFDMLTLEEFNEETSKRKFSERYAQICSISWDKEILDPVIQTQVESVNELDAMVKKAGELGWEGLIIRKDVPYEGKRSNNMLKVKKFMDAEYTVKNLVNGPIRYIKDGKEVEEVMLSAIEIEHKGYTVSVGSGFTIRDRKHYFQNPNDLLGKQVTVMYFEETTNEKGTISLRFPTVKAIYSEERDI